MTDAPPRLREPVPLPAGMTMTDDGAALVIVRRWLRPKHFVLLLVFGAVDAGLGYLWLTSGASPWLVIGTLFATSWNLLLLSMFVNSTTLRATADRIEVTHGPLPSLYSTASLAVADVQQLFAGRYGSAFEVGALQKDGQRVPLMRPLVTEAQAVFVEQRIEHRLGIVDFAVDGELGTPPGVPAAVSKGGGGALAALPLVIIGLAVGGFFLASSSTLEGTLVASGDRLGAFTFAADACSSGQPRGYFGVELTAQGTPGTVLRAIRDPVRGTLLVFERNGGQPLVLSPENCTTLDVQISQTNTRINGVWVMEGRAHADCAELKGSVTFSGCH